MPHHHRLPRAAAARTRQQPAAETTSPQAECNRPRNRETENPIKHTHTHAHTQHTHTLPAINTTLHQQVRRHRGTGTGSVGRVDRLWTKTNNVCLPVSPPRDGTAALLTIPRRGREANLSAAAGAGLPLDCLPPSHPRQCKAHSHTCQPVISYLSTQPILSTTARHRGRGGGALASPPRPPPPLWAGCGAADRGVYKLRSAHLRPACRVSAELVPARLASPAAAVPPKQVLACPCRPPRRHRRVLLARACERQRGKGGLCAAARLPSPLPP